MFVLVIKGEESSLDGSQKIWDISRFNSKLGTQSRSCGASHSLRQTEDSSNLEKVHGALWCAERQ